MTDTRPFVKGTQDEREELAREIQEIIACDLYPHAPLEEQRIRANTTPIPEIANDIADLILKKKREARLDEAKTIRQLYHGGTGWPRDSHCSGYAENCLICQQVAELERELEGAGGG